MITHFEFHAERFIQYYEKTHSINYCEEAKGGIADFKAALSKYKHYKDKWNQDYPKEPVTLQLYSSYSELMNAMIKIFKGELLYPQSLVENLTNNERALIRSAHYGSVEIMICLLSMEKILYCDYSSLSDYELDFPYYFTYRPPIIDDRVRNQSSVFIFQPFGITFYRKDMTPVHAWQRIVPDFVIEIQNPRRIEKELDAIGINSKHIYYDYDHVARYIANQY